MKRLVMNLSLAIIAVMSLAPLTAEARVGMGFGMGFSTFERPAPVIVHHAYHPAPVLVAPYGMVPYGTIYEGVPVAPVMAYPMPMPYYEPVMVMPRPRPARSMSFSFSFGR